MLTDKEFKNQKARILGNHGPLRTSSRPAVSLGVVSAVVIGVLILASVVNPRTPSKVSISTVALTQSQVQTAINVAMSQVGSPKYNGECLLLMREAYLAAGIDIGSSFDPITYWAADPKGYTEYQAEWGPYGTPPAGAILFWGQTQWTSYGHAALSLGNGSVVSSAAYPYTNGPDNGLVFPLSAVNPKTYHYLGYLVPGTLTSTSTSPTPVGSPATPSQSTSGPSYAETSGGVVHTWTNYSNAGGAQGPNVPAYDTIQIACKVTGFKVADGDTWWYLIASSPWNDTYYASADAFYNNGRTSGSLAGTPFVDNNVPNCAVGGSGGGSSSATGSSGSGSNPPPSPTFSETTGGVAHTWTDYADAGGSEGPSIPSNDTVQISCIVVGFQVADGNTWWYQVASSPWNSTYFVSADAFYNNGQTSGSLAGTPFVDPNVPNCAPVSSGTTSSTSSSSASGSTPRPPTAAPTAAPTTAPTTAPTRVQVPTPAPAASKINTTGALTFCPGRTAPCQSSETTLARGTAVSMVCWENPQSDTSHRYFFVQTTAGIEGFVHAGLVSSQTTTPACSTISWINAAQWALGQDGAKMVAANAKNGNIASYWSGWCWLFVYDSWRLGAGHTPRYGGLTAQATYNLYTSHGLMHGATSSPPRGSMVFFRSASAGHVAISLGDGWVETTQGFGGQTLPVTHLRLSQLGLSQLGFVMPANV